MPARRDPKREKKEVEAIDLSKLNDNEFSMYYKETDDDYLYEEWYHFKK